MRLPTRFFGVMLAGLLFHADAIADGIPAKTLAQVKASTVYIKVSAARGSATGSGFILSSDGTSAVIVTNEHVVNLPAQFGPPKSIDVVFNSGKPSEEIIAAAEVLAFDADADLAVLKVSKQKGLPKAIVRATAEEAKELVETATVYTVGFPFGDKLSLTEGNPSLTITKGSVSSLRENESGRLGSIQMEGGTNPGNSGGPLIDEKGRLVGIVVAKISNTNIGFAIPNGELDRLLEGRAVAMKVTALKSEMGKVEVEVRVLIADPLKKIEKLQVHYAKGDQAPVRPEKGKPHPILANSKMIELKREGLEMVGKMALDLEKAIAVPYQFQVAFANAVQASNTLAPMIKRIDSQLQPSSASGFGNEIANSNDPHAWGNGGRGAGMTNPKAAAIDPPALPKESKSLGEVKFEVLKIADGGSFVTKPAPQGLTWSADAKSFFAVDAPGKAIRRYSFPELKELAKLDTGKEPRWISPSAEGLIVTIPDAQEAWIVDAETLKKKSSFSIDKADRVNSSAKSSVAYATGSVNFDSSLSVIDLKTGKPLQQFTGRDLNSFGLENAVISTDGRSLFTTGGAGQLYRLALEGKAVVPAACTDQTLSGAFRGVSVSGDGLLVAAPSGGGSADRADFPKSPYSTFVYAVNNLRKPIAQLKTGAYPQAVGYDPKSGLYFAQNFQSQLIVLDLAGNKLKSLELYKGKMGGMCSAIQFLVHPDGGKLLVLLDNGGVDGVHVAAVDLGIK